MLRIIIHLQHQDHNPDFLSSLQVLLSRRSPGSDLSRWWTSPTITTQVVSNRPCRSSRPLHPGRQDCFAPAPDSVDPYDLLPSPNPGETLPPQLNPRSTTAPLLEDFKPRSNIALPSSVGSIPKPGSARISGRVGNALGISHIGLST